MGTFYLVGIDLETWHGVGLGSVFHEKISTGLVGICEVGAFVHGDEARECGLGCCLKSILVE